MLTTNFAEAGGFIKSAPDEAIPDLQLHFVVGKLVDHGRKTVLGHGYSCHVCLLRPKSRGSLRLASADPQVAPLIDPAFLQDPDDTARLVRGFKVMRRLLQQPALARHGGTESAASALAQSDAQIEQFVRNHADTIYHPVGTLPHGPGPDGRGGRAPAGARRAGAAGGGRVGDAQRRGGNTNAPVIMMAEKAVDMIRQPRLNCARHEALSVLDQSVACEGRGKRRLPRYAGPGASSRGAGLPALLGQRAPRHAHHRRQRARGADGGPSPCTPHASASAAPA